MNVIFCSTGSAFCVLACFGSILAGVLKMFSHWQTGVAFLAIGLVLAAAAKMLDRWKMRLLYGRQLGDYLHEQQDDRSADELASRDLAAFCCKDIPPAEKGIYETSVGRSS